MHREESLQFFLIKRFIQIMAVVGIVEYIVTFLVNQYVMPVVLVRFFPKYLHEISVGGVEIFLLLITVLLLLLVSLLQLLLPAAVRGSVQLAGEQIQRTTLYLLPGLHTNASMIQMERREMVALFLVMSGVALLILLPYAVGAFIYARITLREFREVQKEREQAKLEFDRKRNLMLSDIAHDLRTPMTTVAGYAKALSDGMVKDPGQRQEYLEAIQNKSVRMNDLINLLFEYVKLDSEGFALDKEPLDLCELLRENAALIYSDVETAGMELDVQIPESRIEVTGDKIQLSRVVTNLLTNAIRHNPPGTRIGILVQKEVDRIDVMIADSGELIGDDLVNKMFEPFAKADASRKGGGSGLGLSIARKVVQMHGWKLFVVQQPQIQHYPGAERYAKAFVICIGGPG